MKLSERMQIMHDHDGGKPKSLSGWIPQVVQLEQRLKRLQNYARAFEDDHEALEDKDNAS